MKKKSGRRQNTGKNKLFSRWSTFWKTRFGRKSHKKRPDAERRNGVKVEIRDLKKSGDTPEHRQKQGIFGKADFLKNADFNDNPGKHGQNMESQTGLKVGPRFAYPVPAAAPASQGGCPGRRGRPNVEATAANRTATAHTQLS